MVAYKVLRAGRSPFEGTPWPLPQADQPGAWIEVDGPLRLCENGIHACTVSQLPLWIGDELWTVELDGELLDAPVTTVARRARLLSPVTGWDRDARARFTDGCVARGTALAAGRPDLREVLELVRTFARIGVAASVAYWSAVLAGDSASPTRAGDAYEERFAAERVAQADWLRAGLALVG